MTTACASIAAMILLAATPAAAQTGVAAYAGEWVGSGFTVESGSWPETAAEDITVAIDGGDGGFAAGWSGLVPAEDAAAWDDLAQEFEPADRPGFYAPEDEGDVFDGEPQYWAFVGEAGLVLGRLQIDSDSGRHVIFVCRLVPTDAGLDAELVLSAAEAEIARARVSLVKQ
jgi:hypothetical protein